MNNGLKLHGFVVCFQTMDERLVRSASSWTSVFDVFDRHILRITVRGVLPRLELKLF